MGDRKIYITDFWTETPDVEQEAIGSIGAVTALGAQHESELLPRVADADALLVWHDIKLTDATINALEKCKAIVRIGVGYDNVPLESTRAKGIVVCNVPDYGVEEVADHTIAMMLALVRNLPRFGGEVRSTPVHWDACGVPTTPRLRGKVFGIVGLGRIGSATALRAKAFGLDVVACDPYIPDGRGKSLGVRIVDKHDELYARSDFVSIHTPLNETTRKMINAESLAKFKRGAILINTARGPICDTGAILKALERGQLGGAGLDVLPTEPPSADDPLIAAARSPEHVAFQRCILTPHSAFFTAESFEEMRRKAALEVRRALLGEPVRNRVN